MKLQLEVCAFGIQSCLVEMAYPMHVTCNYAFDAAPRLFAALEAIIDAGCERVLTSDLAATATEGVVVLKQLVIQAGGRISIMPGDGVCSGNIAALIKQTGAWEYHTSTRKSVVNPMSFSTPLVSDTGNYYVADEPELASIIGVLNK